MRISLNSLQKRFENLTRNYTKLGNEHSALVTDLSSSKTKRLEIESEMEDTQKELQKTKEELEEVKRNRIDPKELEEARNHVRELSAQLNQKENKAKGKKDDLNKLREEGRNLRDYIKRQKEEYEEEIQAQKENYEEKFKRQDRELRNKFKNYMSPGEIKSIELLLGKVDSLKLTDEEYDVVIKSLRTARDKFKRNAENPSLNSIKRGYYDRLRKDMDYRIDNLNAENNKPIETEIGREIMNRYRKLIPRQLNKIWRLLKENFTLFSALGGIAGIIYYAVTFLFHHGSRATIEFVKTIVPILKSIAPTIANGVLEGGLSLAKGLISISQSFITICIVLVGGYLTTYLFRKDD